MSALLYASVPHLPLTVPSSSFTSLPHQPFKSYTSITMAANTKYQPAPQRDSFEEANYTQAPPSYQAEPSHGNAPRGEDDNVPDDFKVWPNHFNVAHLSCADKSSVWWFGRGGYATDQDAVHSQGVLNPVSRLRAHIQTCC
jgi:hypothetical protein